MELPLGRNSTIYDYKTACNAPAKSDNRIRSTDNPKVAEPQICPGQRAGQSHLPRYYSSAEAQCSSCSTSHIGSGPSLYMATPLCMWQDITMTPDSYLNIQIVIARSRENQRRPSMYSIKCTTSSKLSTQLLLGELVEQAQKQKSIQSKELANT